MTVLPEILRVAEAVGLFADAEWVAEPNRWDGLDLVLFDENGLVRLTAADGVWGAGLNIYRLNRNGVLEGSAELRGLDVESCASVVARMLP